MSCTLKNDMVGNSVGFLSNNEPTDAPLFYFFFVNFHEDFVLPLGTLQSFVCVSWLHDNIQDNFVNNSQIQNLNI